MWPCANQWILLYNIKGQSIKENIYCIVLYQIKIFYFARDIIRKSKDKSNIEGKYLQLAYLTNDCI